MSSRNPYASNGYSNKNATNTTASSRYGDFYGQENPSQGSVNSHASRERRAGGWGGFGDSSHEPSPHPPPTRNRYGSNEENDWRRPQQRVIDQQHDDSSRSRDRAPPRMNGMNGYRSSPARRGGRSMDEILRYIQSDWNFMGGDECVPVQVALKLMDPSTLGLADREPQFQQTHVDLQSALKSIVNDHHQDFNSSIGTYHKIQSSIQNSQSRVRYLKNALDGARGGLLTTKPELKGLATSSQRLDDNLQLFTQIENLQSVPEKLEARISEKRFLGAVDILQEALRLVRKSEFDDMGAVNDLQTYFSNQEQSLTDILVEELHDHLYLKSPYCHDRWQAKAPGGEDEGQRAAMGSTGVNSWDKPVYHYLSKLDMSVPMADEDSTRNPEADTFYYIHMTIEALSRLGNLDALVSRVEQRMPVELYKVVDRTNNEVDARHPGHVRNPPKQGKRSSIATGVEDGQAAVLSDFLWSLYAKLEAIAEGHRVVHEVITGLVAREKLSDSENLTKGFKELWKLYQSEMRSLLHDYLATGGGTTSRANLSNPDSGNVFGRNRDKTKRMFKFTKMDSKSSSMKSEQQDLDDILKSSVPGLVSKSRGKTDTNGDRQTTLDGTATGHKLVVEPSVFNVTTCLPPTLSFLQRLKDIVPANSNIAMSTLASFLDDFLVNVFHPQLEEAVTELSTQCFIDLEAFTEDPQWQKYSPRPVFKGTVAFMSLINAFSSMLNAIPQDQIFTQLVITQLHTYYDKCYGWYKAIVSRLAPSSVSSNATTLSLKAAASYAESGEIREAAVDLLKEDLTPEARHELGLKEIQLLQTATKSSPLHPYDIISDPKSVTSLSLFYNSMQWLSSSLSRLRHVDSSTSTSTSRSRPSSQQPNSRRWTLIASLKPLHTASASGGASGNIPTTLPLTTESVIAFDSTLSSFRTLAQTALITLHIDIRLGIVHELTRSLRGPNAPPIDSLASQATRDSTALPATDSGQYHWFLPQPPTSASPMVLELNGDLIKFDTNTSTYLGVKERAFITTGLAKLLDRMLVVGADYIQVMNAHGAERMELDILVLQQNLRNIAVSAEKDPIQNLTNGVNAGDAQEAILAQSAQFYDLFLQGADKVMAFVKENKSKASGVGYTYDELRTLIELCYSSALRSQDREDNVKAKKGMQECLLQLGELLWDS